MGLIAILVLAFLAGVLTGIKLRLAGFAAFLAVFIGLASGFAIWLPSYAPPVSAFILTIVTMQVGYLVGIIAEAYMLSGTRTDEKPATRRSEDGQLADVVRSRRFWLK